MRRFYLAVMIATTLSGVGLVGCGHKDSADASAAKQQMPPTVVSVQTVEFQKIPLYKTLSGRTTAYQTAEVRPQVSGIIDEVLFNEGSMVKAGQPLYRINTDNYASSVARGQAALQQSKANLATAKANLMSQQALYEQAKADLGRLKGLLEVNAISQQQYDQAITQVKTTQATVESAKAAVEQAQAGIDTAKAGLSASQLDLSRTIVRAPITGRTDRSLVTAGALVNANQTQPLVTISRLNPIYVDISQSSSDMLNLRQQIADGTVQAGVNEVELVLEDGSIYPVKGQIALAEAKVDESSGAITLRAIFPNENDILLPGMFVNARMAQSVINNAVLLPQSAVSRTPKGETLVYVVDDKNKIAARPVTIDGTYEGKWIVSSGLKAGEQVVVVGASKVQPEQEVVIKPLSETQPNTEAGTPSPMANANESAAKTSNQPQPNSNTQSSTK